MRELVERYAVTGGIPKYIELFDDSGDIFEAIESNVLNRSGVLYDEPMFLLRGEGAGSRHVFFDDQGHRRRQP